MTDFPRSLIEFQQRFGDEAACAQYGRQGGLLADPISGLAVLEYGPTEILPPVSAYRNTLRVSLDLVVKPAAHTRAESRGS
jgi:hypothetical protein